MQRYFIPPLQARDEVTDQLAWLVLIQWFLYAGQLGVLALGTALLFIPSGFAPGLMLSAVFLLGMNTLTCRYLHTKVYARATQEHREVLLLALLLLNLVQFLFVLGLTQGLQNPFYPLLFVYVTLSAVLLPPQYGWAYLIVAAAGIYMMNPVVYVFNAQNTYVRTSALVSWGIQMGVVLATWFIAAGVSQRRVQYQRRWEQLKHQQDRLQKVHLLGALGAGMAHEFATPLNTLRLRLDRLRRKVPESLLDDVNAANQALTRSEQKLRALAALPTREELENLIPLDPVQVLLPLWQRWQRQHPDIHWELDNQWPETRLLKVPELLLKQGLDNLIRNAVKALERSETPNPAISLQLRCTQQHFCLTLQDTGPGWPEQILKHFGEPFVTTYRDGTGLGLYTVYMLAQSMSGELTLSQNTPTGACATLCLP